MSIDANMMIHAHDRQEDWKKCGTPHIAAGQADRF